MKEKKCCKGLRGWMCKQPFSWSSCNAPVHNGKRNHERGRLYMQGGALRDDPKNGYEGDNFLTVAFLPPQGSGPRRHPNVPRVKKSIVSLYC